MSDEYLQVTVDSVLKGRTAGYWGVADPTDKATERVNVVRAGDISPDGRLLGTAERWFKPREVTRALCDFGDVLITASGNGLGKCYLVRESDSLASSNFTRRLSPNPELVLGHFLYLALQSQLGASKLIEHTATSAFPNLKPTFFEDPWLPLPPLPVQRRIVDLMAHLDNHLANLQTERDACLELAHQAACESLAQTRMSGHESMLPLSSAWWLDSSVEKVAPDKTYRIAGVLNAGQGIIDKGSVTIDSTRYQRLIRLKAGQVLMRRLTAWEGPIAVVPEKFDGFYVSNEFPTFTVNEDVMDIGYAEMLCRWPGLWDEMRQRVTGSVMRRKRLSAEQLLSVSVPVPDLGTQRAVAAATAELRRRALLLDEEVLALETTRTAALSALLDGRSVIPDSYDSLLSQVA